MIYLQRSVYIVIFFVMLIWLSYNVKDKPYFRRRQNFVDKSTLDFVLKRILKTTSIITDWRRKAFRNDFQWAPGYRIRFHAKSPCTVILASDFKRYSIFSLHSYYTHRHRRMRWGQGALCPPPPIFFWGGLLACLSKYVVGNLRNQHVPLCRYWNRRHNYFWRAKKVHERPPLPRGFQGWRGLCDSGKTCQKCVCPPPPPPHTHTHTHWSSIFANFLRINLFDLDKYLIKIYVPIVSKKL